MQQGGEVGIGRWEQVAGHRCVGRLLLAFFVTAGTIGTAGAGPQADAALAAVERLVASGEIPRGATLRLAFKPGNVNALLGAELELQREWETKTGTLISARVIPNVPALVNLRANPDVDLTVARPHEYQELIEQGLALDLSELARRFGLSLDGKPPQGFIRPQLQAYYGNRLVALPADGDVAMLYLRSDLLDDSAEQAAFRARFGRPLAVPQTWEDYDDLVAFFHRPEQGLVGAAEERDPEGGWMFWMQRYASQEKPYRPLFDARARPLIDSPEGIKATAHYVYAARHSTPEITEAGRDYSYVLPLFMQGKAFAVMTTLAGAKLFNSAGSAVRGKFVAVPMPGFRVGSELVRRNVPIYGNNLVVAAHGRQRTLAFLFAMWLTDPDVSLRTVGVQGGHTDPYRWHHLQDSRVSELYTRQALEVAAGEWAIALPAGTGMANDSEYLAVLDRNLWRAAQREISAGEAMRDTAREWERITVRVGRQRQIAALRAAAAGFPRRGDSPPAGR